jgi:hypothetical protein
MTEENEVKTGELSVDESTMSEIMSYYRIDNHDEPVRYIRHLEIEHID